MPGIVSYPKSWPPAMSPPLKAMSPTEVTADDFDEGRRWKMWKMCPTEIRMCIKLLVDLDTSLKIIDEITPKTKTPKKMLPSPTKKTFTGI